jgi:hypothetical protein
MTREADIGAGRRAAAPVTREELTRRLLALVLAAVLVWYTVVIPSGAHAKRPAAHVPDDEGRDGEVRGSVGGAPADLRARSVAAAQKGFAFGPAGGESARESVEELDWPEYIYLD